MRLVHPAQLQAAANTDPEFRMAARYWNATLSLESPAPEQIATEAGPPPIPGGRLLRIAIHSFLI
jgi:hypothetical protein